MATMLNRDSGGLGHCMPCLNWISASWTPFTLSTQVAEVESSYAYLGYIPRELGEAWNHIRFQPGPGIGDKVKTSLMWHL